MSVNSTVGFISVEELNQAGEKRLEVELPNGNLILTYDPQEYTPELERQMNEMTRKGGVGQSLSRLLMKVLRSWMVLNEKERVLPARPGRYERNPDGSTLRDEHTNRPVPEGELVLKAGDVLPLNERILDQMIGIFAQSKIVAAIMRDQAPNEPTSQQQEDSW